MAGFELLMTDAGYETNQLNHSATALRQFTAAGVGDVGESETNLLADFLNDDEGLNVGDVLLLAGGGLAPPSSLSTPHTSPISLSTTLSHRPPNSSVAGCATARRLEGLSLLGHWGLLVLSTADAATVTPADADAADAAAADAASMDCG